MIAPDAGDASGGWERLLSVLIDEIEGAVEPSLRESWLRGAGVRLARQRPLPAVATLASFEDATNAELAKLAWGRVRVDLDADAQILAIEHDEMPWLASAPREGWPRLIPFFEGLYTGWLGQQRTVGGAYLSARGLTPRRDGHSFLFVYGRADRVDAVARADLAGCVS